LYALLQFQQFSLFGSHLVLQRLEFLVQMQGLRIHLRTVRSECLRLQFEDELAAFAAHHVADRRSLFGKLGNNRAHVGAQFGGGDDAVAVQIGRAIQALEQRPGENGMAVRPVIRTC